MRIDRQQDGLYFELEGIDWKGDWRTLLEFVKSYKRYEYDEMNKRWWIGEENVIDFMALKRDLIDKYINPNQTELF